MNVDFSKISGKTVELSAKSRIKMNFRLHKIDNLGKFALHLKHSNQDQDKITNLKNKNL